MRGNPYLGIVIDNRIPQDYVIKREPEPLLKQGFAYRVYFADGRPLYMGEPTLAEAESRLKRGYPVKSITVVE